MKSIVPSLLALLSFAAVAPAAESKHVRYVAPEGFAGHKWDDLRSTFDRLPEKPIGVGAAFMLTIQKQNDFTCVQSNPTGPITGAVGGCDFQATLLRLRTNFEGGGVYVPSEDTIEGRGFRFGAT